jgi:hypothetical protein
LRIRQATGRLFRESIDGPVDVICGIGAAAGYGKFRILFVRLVNSAQQHTL